MSCKQKTKSFQSKFINQVLLGKSVITVIDVPGELRSVFPKKKKRNRFLGFGFKTVNRGRGKVQQCKEQDRSHAIIKTVNKEKNQATYTGTMKAPPYARNQ